MFPLLEIQLFVSRVKGGGTEKESFRVLTHSPSVLNGQGWSTLKPGVRNSHLGLLHEQQGHFLLPLYKIRGQRAYIVVQ